MFKLSRPRRTALLLRGVRYASGQQPKVVIGLRKEDPTRIWERRTPLTPDAVKYLVKEKNVAVVVEQCARRVCSSAQYRDAGAIIVDSLNSPGVPRAHIVMGIKEPPMETLTDSALDCVVGPTGETVPRTYLMFSHTTKAQPYNMPLLAKFLQQGRDDPITRPRLIDYELITDQENGKRTVAFGFFAGIAGALEALGSMAQSHLERGIASPFLYTPRPHGTPSLSIIRKHLEEKRGTPQELGPVIFGVTGNGQVSKGMLHMLEELPVKWIGVKDLPKLLNPAAGPHSLRQIYLYHVKPEDYLVRQDGKPYSRPDYYENPGEYESHFADRYLTLMLNGVGWSPGFPRLMFENVADVSCDVQGGLEFLPRATTLSEPSLTIQPSPDLPPVRIMAVDILPASLPADASIHFTNVLLPYLEALIEQYTGEEASDPKRLQALNRATISDGTLVPRWSWLGDEVVKVVGGDVGRKIREVMTTKEQETESASMATSKPASSLNGMKRKKVLLLGSGMVAKPTVDTLAARKDDIELIIASNSLAEAEKLASLHPNVSAKLVQFEDRDEVDRLVGESDLVISLLPATMHVGVAELCLKHQKHLVTASYISPDMAALHQRAVERDVLLLNEIGLDPGIDHCSAVSLIERIQKEKKEVLSFTSFCGGLPAPDVGTDVPLRYKFSWSPRGVLSAAGNEAVFKVKGKEVRVPGDELLQSVIPNLPITKEFDLEGIPNRNSLPYAETYDLSASGSLRTIMRGTLRYPGFCQLLDALRRRGFLETREKVTIPNWSSFLELAMSFRATEEKLTEKDEKVLTDALKWFNLLPSSHSTSMPPLPTGPVTPIDAFAVLLSHKLAYAPGERDMVVLHHEILARIKDGEAAAVELEEEKYTSSLIAYGDKDSSAMAKTVGLPVAIAALAVLDGKVGSGVRGVAGPTTKGSGIWKPVLLGLEELGIGMVEKVTKVQSKGERTVESVVAERWTL
ncbi:Saccharopine dehydrogenase-domain-containing protein [Flagelloscypha sp. PMI_526]|nr:Saccharopine dehydrogenase-domain-containing protein [Flagelloscypha sp. PMI_526]